MDFGGSGFSAGTTAEGDEGSFCVVAIDGVGIVREADGLAMSSRNAYLSPDDRQRAAALPRAMEDAAAVIADGGDAARALGNLKETLRASGFDSVDYADLRDADSLAPLDTANGNALGPTAGVLLLDHTLQPPTTAGGPRRGLGKRPALAFCTCAAVGWCPTAAAAETRAD